MYVNLSGLTDCCSEEPRLSAGSTAICHLHVISGQHHWECWCEILAICRRHTAIFFYEGEWLGTRHRHTAFMFHGGERLKSVWLLWYSGRSNTEVTRCHSGSASDIWRWHNHHSQVLLLPYYSYQARSSSSVIVCGPDISMQPHQQTAWLLQCAISINYQQAVKTVEQCSSWGTGKNIIAPMLLFLCQLNWLPRCCQ